MNFVKYLKGMSLILDKMQAWTIQVYTHGKKVNLRGTEKLVREIMMPNDYLV